MKKRFLIICLLTLISSELLPKSRKALGKNLKASSHEDIVLNKKILKLPDVAPSKKELLIKTQEKATQQEPLKKSKEELNEKTIEPKLYLNFENAELENFINYVAELKKINIIPDKSIKNKKISLNIRQPLTGDEAWKILHTIADMAGFIIIKIGNVYKIMPKDKREKEAVPVYINDPLKRLPDSDETIRYIKFLNNTKVADIIPMVNSMLNHAAIPQENINGMVLIDKSYNIKSTLKIINSLDETGLQESVVVIKLREVNAVEVKDLLKSLIGDNKKPEHPFARLFGKKGAEPPSTYFSPNTKIIAEERTNSLILLGTKRSTERIETFIRENVDKKLADTETPLYVYELQYADAKQLATILKEVTTAPASIAGQQAEKYGAVRSGVKYFKKMIIKADDIGNRLIVNCSDKSDWILLKETIRNIDKPQPLVAIECLIVQVDVSDVKSFGGQTRNKKGALGRNINFQSTPLNSTILQSQTVDSVTTVQSLLGNLIGGVTSALGKSILTFGKAGDIWSIFEMLKQQTNTSLIAQPFLTVANKYKSEIKIGETKRATTQTVGTGDTATTGLTAVEATLRLTVKPQINIDGIINMEVSVQNDDFINNDPNNKNERLLETEASVADGQVLALGGFIKTKITESVYKPAIIGDIPILGWLVKKKSKTLTKQNILIFLSPTIIKPRTSPGINIYSKMKLDLAKKAIDTSISIGKTMDPIHDWFFNIKNESYAHKVNDFSKATFQPVTVNIKNDPMYNPHANTKDTQ